MAIATTATEFDLMSSLRGLMVCRRSLEALSAKLTALTNDVLDETEQLTNTFERISADAETQRIDSLAALVEHVKSASFRRHPEG